MHVAVFLQYYHTPDCPTAARPYALIERLSRDHEVTVITTRAWEGKRQAQRFPWVPPGVRLVRFDVPYDNTMTPSQRLGAFLRYAARAFTHGLKMPRPDVLLGSSSPLTAAAVTGALARLRGLPWIFEVRDLWPDFPIQMGAIPELGVSSLLRRLESRLYRSAAHVVTLSPDMEQHVRTVAPRASVSTLTYGSDFQLVEAISSDQLSDLRERFSLDRQFLVLYAGTFGRANAIPTLIEAAERLSHRSDVLLAFAGQGHHDALVRRAARRHDHLRKIPPIPYPDALALFRLADVSLVSFLDRPVLAANSPAKFFDSLATGTPVVVTNPGWTTRFVEEHDCGWSVPAESSEALARRLDALFEAPDRLADAGRKAHTVARHHFGRSKIMDQYTALVESVAPSSSSLSST